MRPTLPFLLLFAAACGSKRHLSGNDSILAARDSLTRHQKDSIVAHSTVPGASVVGRAMTVQDSEAAHQRLVDSVANAP